MKKLFYLLLALPVISFSQTKKENYDYFVQFNTPQFAKKVNLDSLFNHKAFKEFNRESADFKLKDFISFIDRNRAISIHGNFTDSIPFYQLTIPLAKADTFEQFLQDRISKQEDSIPDNIQKMSGYNLFSSKHDDFTIAWNAKDLVIFGLLEDQNYDSSLYGYNYDDYDDSVVVEEVEEYDEEYNEEYEEGEVVAVETVEVLPPPPTEQEIEAAYEWEQEEEYEEEPVVYDENYYQQLDEEYRKAAEQARKEKHAKQEALLAQLFEKGFTAPTFSKVNTKADISSWVDYQSVYSKMSNFYYLFRTFTPRVTTPTNYAIEGMGADFFFENGKARMEQTVEYSPDLAKIMRKVVNRKPNKNAFNHFPKTEPLAYLTYHISTAEVLKNYPKIAEQMLANLPIEKQDTEIVTDLISTLIDEEATATLFDGDFTIFFHNMEQYEYTYTGIEYDDDYEQIEVEKTITKNKPVFTVMFTSTHPTIGQKLINLGMRKNLLIQENGYYSIKGTDDLGDIALIKDQDVIIFTNGLDYLNTNSQSDFAKKVKKNLSSNYSLGNLDINGFVKSYMMNEDFGRDTESILKLSNQFKNIRFNASKKIKNNTMKLEAEFNATSTEKNIIIQTLDLVEYLK